MIKVSRIFFLLLFLLWPEMDYYTISIEQNGEYIQYNKEKQLQSPENKERKYLLSEVIVASILNDFAAFILSNSDETASCHQLHDVKKNKYVDPSTNSDSSESDLDESYPIRKKRKKVIKKKQLPGYIPIRNLYACSEHKRRHQKCPMDCVRRHKL
jgi:hypothetical protein